MATLLLNYSAAANPLEPFSPPSGFTPVAQIDLSVRAYEAKTLAQFSVDEPAYVGVFIAVHDIDTTYFDLRVTGPSGYSSIVMHGEGYRADRDGGLWEENLSPGSYHIVLASHQSSGIASIYLKGP